MATSDDESCRIRQSLECQALEAIFTSQIRILEGEFESEDNWTPLSCIVTLVPPNTYTVNPDRPSVDVQINCGKNYPNELPEINVVNWKKIPNKDIRILIRHIESNYDAWKGKEMIYDLCNCVGEFLGYYSRPTYNSFHDEMVNRQKAMDEMIAQENAAKKQKEMAEIQERKEIVRKALRRKSHSKDASVDECQESEGYRSSSAVTEEVPNVPPPEPEKDQDWTSLAVGKSRFHSDFDLINWLGAGAYGRVAKVRNKVDDRHYAIKEIKLDMSNKSFNKTIVREVKLLSRLNHENVVRYYNSWFEMDQDERTSVNDDDEGPCVSSKDYNVMEAQILCEKRSFYFTPNYGEDDSDDIYFERSQFDGSDEYGESTLHRGETSVESDELNNPYRPPLLMYIQMELCDRSTLRNEIDENLYKDVDRAARLFREIVEGLAHIHQLSIIHRDLKPGNIFISDNDHVKIGDFGLATSVRFKGAQTVSTNYPQSQETGTSHSSNVGTYFYIAPEVGNKAAKKHYNQKVDIFSLGIIFFEMNHPCFVTGMERYKVLTQLTTQDVNVPESFPHGPTSPAYKLVKWMLSHNPKERPSAADLLSSHYLPPPVLEDAEVKDVIRQTLENPQSKIYKYMMESCFSQSLPPAVSASFNVATWRSVPFLISLGIVTEKLRGIFHRHGAVSCLTPLLIPAIDPPPKAECLMTRDGSIVYPTRDVQTSFARLLIDNSPITNLKRYAIDKVYEARPVGLHPKEIYQCSFDVVTPRHEDQGSEIEVLSVVWEILNEFPQLINKSCVLYLNHASIVKAMFGSLGITESSKVTSICQAILHAKSECYTKQELVEYLMKSTDLHEHTVLSVYNWTSIEGSLTEVSHKVRALSKTDEDSEMCTRALTHLENVINRCELIGINTTIKVKLGVIQPTLNSGLIFQVECSTNNKMKSLDGNVLIAGGNYDNLLDDLKAKYPDAEDKITQSVTGFVLHIEKLITALDCQGKYQLVDIVLFSLGATAWTPPRIKFATDLWRSGFKVIYLRVRSMEETQAFASFYGASFIIIMKESDQALARLKSVSKEWKHFDKNLSFPEVLEYLNTVLKAPGLTWATKTGPEPLTTSAKKNVVIVFVECEFKFRKKLSASITAAMMSFSEKLSNSAKIVVIAVPLSREAVKNFVYELDMCDYHPDPSSFDKKLSKYNKKVIGKLLSEFEEHKKDSSAVIVIYSIPEGYYKPLINVQ